MKTASPPRLSAPLYMRFVHAVWYRNVVAFPGIVRAGPYTAPMTDQEPEDDFEAALLARLASLDDKDPDQQRDDAWYCRVPGPGQPDAF